MIFGLRFRELREWSLRVDRVPSLCQPSDVLWAQELDYHAIGVESTPMMPPVGIHCFQDSWPTRVGECKCHELAIRRIEAGQHVVFGEVLILPFGIDWEGDELAPRRIGLIREHPPEECIPHAGLPI